jgi:4-diphosphocytidyl-2-C-methyl-D-erythritol kinase
LKEPPLTARQLDRAVVRAPAKLNLHLTAGPLRPDGFHDLTTVFQAVSLFDELTATRADALTLTVTGEGAETLPTDSSNLAVRAVELLAAGTGQDPHVTLSLTKAIPVAGGCAGGSADAAAALVACDALWGTGLSKEELTAYAARLGSDVPFSLHGGTALGTSRGDQLTTVLGHGTYAWVLALADGGLSTPAVFAELDRQRAAGPSVPAGDPSDVLAALRSGNPVTLGHALSNDLQAAALTLCPELQVVLSHGRELGALGVTVTGSGPTVALLAQDGRHADELAAALLALGVCRAVRRADGPAPGAKVVG